MRLRWTPEELEDVMSPNTSPQNMEKKVYLRMRLNQLDNLKIELQNDNRPHEDVSVIRDMVIERLFGKERPTSGTFVRFFVEHLGRYDKRSTRESNEYTLSVMRKYCDKVDELDFEDINYAWLSDMEDWMKKARMSQNTRKIHFGNIRTAMREAYKRELTNADPFRRFTFKPAKTRKRCMELDLLRELFCFPVQPFAEIYRDMFKLIFMLIGINTVDLYNLSSIAADGRVEFARSKTNGLFSIKVEPEAMEIINKYKGEKNLLVLADRWTDHRNFRHQMNAAIKRIGKAQGKGKKDLEGDGPFAVVTSYWARHTWATIAADLDIPDATISLALGHAGENKVTDIYIQRNQKKVDEANRKVIDWVLYGKR